MICKGFYFILKVLFVVKVKFKIYDGTTWLRNNSNTHIAQYLSSKDNQTMKFD